MPSGGGVAFKLHYFQVDTAPMVFGTLIWGFLSNFHKQNKSGSGNSTIRVCYHQNQIFDDQPHSAPPGVSLSKLDTRERTDAGELSRTNCNPASHHLVGWDSSREEDSLATRWRPLLRGPQLSNRQTPWFARHT